MFLREVRTVDWPENAGYPFSLPACRSIQDLEFDQFATFFVGENGSGKSTLLEAIAIQSGFNAEGGIARHPLFHGESFLNLFSQRLSNRSPALYLLDEPEAALSPARSL